MKNNYRIENDVVFVEVVSKGVTHEVLIDIDTLERLKAEGKSIFKQGKYFAVRTPEKNVYLHRYIMNAEKGIEIDHKNRNKADNREDNLKVSTRLENMQNRASENVYYDKQKDIYRIKVMRNGVTHYAGTSKTLREAKIKAQQLKERVGNGI